jgi:hypothetical protein
MGHPLVRKSEFAILILVRFVMSLLINMINKVEQSESDDKLEPVILEMLLSLWIHLKSGESPETFVQVLCLIHV